MYKLTNTTTIIRIVDNLYIPMDTSNTEYLEYLVWVQDGNTAEAYIAPPTPVPSTVTMRQARLALLQAGKLAAVSAAIASLSSPQKEAAQIEWEYSAEVQRDKALVQLLAPALNLTETDLDDLFILAATL